MKNILKPSNLAQRTKTSRGLQKSSYVKSGIAQKGSRSRIPGPTSSHKDDVSPKPRKHKFTPTKGTTQKKSITRGKNQTSLISTNKRKLQPNFSGKTKDPKHSMMNRSTSHLSSLKENPRKFTSLAAQGSNIGYQPPSKKQASHITSLANARTTMKLKQHNRSVLMFKSHIDPISPEPVEKDVAHMIRSSVENINLALGPPSSTRESYNRTQNLQLSDGEDDLCLIDEEQEEMDDMNEGETAVVANQSIVQNRGALSRFSKKTSQSFFAAKREKSDLQSSLSNMRNKRKLQRRKPVLIDRKSNIEVLV